MSPSRGRSILLAAVGALTALFAAAGTASAQTTIGEVAPAGVSASCTFGPAEFIPEGSAAPDYTVPVSGVITSWSTRSASAAGQELTFKAYRPGGAGSISYRYTVVGRDGPRALVPGTVNTFDTEIHVQAGDLIGLNDANAAIVPNACFFHTGSADFTGFQYEDFDPGEEFEAVGAVFEARVNVSATLLTSPTISSVSPARGPATGGTTVTIDGTEFAHVVGVTVGAHMVPFDVASESTITAQVPAGPAATSVPVTVTTVAGFASASFSYEEPAGSPPTTPAAVSPPPSSSPPPPTCRVPKLKGKSARAARRALREADCRLGKVARKKGVTARNGKVVRQRPKPGTERGAGSRVGVRLG